MAYSECFSTLTPQTDPGAQKLDFWLRFPNSLINSPVILGLSGGLGIEAAAFLKAGSIGPLAP